MNSQLMSLKKKTRLKMKERALNLQVSVHILCEMVVKNQRMIFAKRVENV
jgi:hypothetical protein